MKEKVVVSIFIGWNEAEASPC